MFIPLLLLLIGIFPGFRVHASEAIVQREHFYILPVGGPDSPDIILNGADLEPVRVAPTFMRASEKISKLGEQCHANGSTKVGAIRVQLSRVSFELLYGFFCAMEQPTFVREYRLKLYTLPQLIDIAKSSEYLETYHISLCAIQYIIRYLTSHPEELCSHKEVLTEITQERQLKNLLLSELRKNIFQDLLPHFFTTLRSVRELVAWSIEEDEAARITLMGRQPNGTYVAEFWDPDAGVKLHEHVVDHLQEMQVIRKSTPSVCAVSPHLCITIEQSRVEDSCVLAASEDSHISPRESNWGTMRLVDISRGEEEVLQTWQLRSPLLCIHPMGYLVLCAHEQGGSILNLLEDVQEHTLIHHHRFLFGAFHPTQPQLAVVDSQRECIMWNSIDRLPLWRIILDSPCKSLAFSASGSLFIVETDEGAIHLWHDDTMLRDAIQTENAEQALFLHIIASIVKRKSSYEPKVFARVAPVFSQLRASWQGDNAKARAMHDDGSMLVSEKRGDLDNHDEPVTADLELLMSELDQMPEEKEESVQTKLTRLLQLPNAQSLLSRMSPTVVTRLLLGADLHEVVSLRQAVESGDGPVLRFLLQHGASELYPDKDGTTALHWAAMTGRCNLVLILLEADVRPDQQDRKKRTALHYAASGGHDEVIKELLAVGADHSSLDDEQKTPLSYAVEAGKLSTVTLLLRHQMVGEYASWNVLHYAVHREFADVVTFLIESRAHAVDERDAQGITPLQRTVDDGQAAIVRLLLSKNAQINVFAEGDSKRLTPVHTAVKRGDTATLQVLIDWNASLTDRTNTGDSPLYFAASYGQHECARLLLKSAFEAEQKARSQSPKKDRLSLAIPGVKKRGMHDPNSRGLTPLHEAVLQGDVEMISILLQGGAHINAKSLAGLTALHCAAEKGHADALGALLASGADINAQTTDERKCTALDVTVDNNDYEATKTLLRNGAKIDLAGILKRTALHRAAMKGRAHLIALFLEGSGAYNASNGNNGNGYVNNNNNNASPHNLLPVLNLQDSIGYTALHWAAQEGAQEIVGALLRAGADPSILDSRGLTPACRALEQGHVTIAELLIKHEMGSASEIVQGEVDTHGWTPLHFAAYRGYERVVLLLILHGVSKLILAQGTLPFEVAQKYGHQKIADMLKPMEVEMTALRAQEQQQIKGTIQQKKNTDGRATEEESAASRLEEIPVAVDSNGTNALHSAARKGLTRECENLLDCGIGIESTNNEGWTPLHFAVSGGYVETVELLLKRGASRTARTLSGETALHSACAAGMCEIAQRVLDYWPQEAQLRKEDYPQRCKRAGIDHKTANRGAVTPLHCAVLSGNEDLVKLLIDSKANVVVADGEGITPLHLAVQLEKEKCVQLLLLTEGSLVGAVDSRGRSPLTIALELKTFAIVQLLVAHEMSPHEWAAGWELIHWAAHTGNQKLALYLLDKGVDVQAKTDDATQQTAHQIAKKRGHTEVAALLVKQSN